MAAFTLRDEAEADRSGLEAIAAEIVRDGSVFPFEDVPGVLAYWHSSGSHGVVALDQHGLAGAYVLKPNHPGRGAHVCNAGYMVAERSRGQGLGRRLGEHSLVRARELGYVAMQFNQVVRTNRVAIGLWQRLGFQTIGEVPLSFRHPQQGLVGALVMFREL